MEQFYEALQRGKEVRKLQDEVLALFTLNVQRIDSKELLEAIKKELEGGK